MFRQLDSCPRWSLLIYNQCLLSDQFLSDLLISGVVWNDQNHKNMIINQVVCHGCKYYLMSDEPYVDDEDDVAWPEVTLHGQMLYNLLMKQQRRHSSPRSSLRSQVSPRLPHLYSGLQICTSLLCALSAASKTLRSYQTISTAITSNLVPLSALSPSGDKNSFVFSLKSSVSLAMIGSFWRTSRLVISRRRLQDETFYMN